MGLIFMITLPATLGLILLARPVLGFLFQWGLFDSRDVDAAVPVLVASVLGMPFFAWSTLLTRSWYARQEMRTPVRLAALNLFLNLLLGLCLMQFWGATGLALANTFSAFIHCLALQYFLPGKGLLRVRLRTVASLCAGLLALGAIALAGNAAVELLPLAGKLRDLVTIAAVIPLAAGGYFAVLWLAGHPGLAKRAARAA
jgi:putative peptidoglycan lipid II flippase